MNLEPALNPRSLAIVGASNDLKKMGSRVLNYAIQHGYPGELVPVNPKGGMVHGLEAVANLSSVGREIDCGVLAIGSEFVSDVIREGIDAGVRSFVVLASGYAEVGASGRAMQTEIRAIAEAAGVAVIGPNSNGFVNFTLPLAATSNPTLEFALRKGRIGLVSQSGGLSLGSLLYMSQRRNLGYSFQVSTGNEAHVATADVVNFLATNAETKVIGCIIEGLPDARAWREAVEKATSFGKPVVVLHVGKSDLGRIASATHTGVLTGSRANMAALIRQAGAIEVEGVAEFLDVLMLLDRQIDRTEPSTLGVISPSGGAAILAADLCSEYEMPIAELSNATKDSLTDLLPGFASISNPLDLTAVGTSDPNIYPSAFDAILADPGVDAVCPILTVNWDYDPLFHHFVTAAASSTKLVLPVLMGGPIRGTGASILTEGNLTPFDDLNHALRALKHVTDWSTRQRGGTRRSPAHANRVDDGAIESLTAVLRSPTGDEASVHDALRACGLPIVRAASASTAPEAIQAATEIGYPVALKGELEGVTHKSDFGMVKLGLEDPDAVSAAFAEVEVAANAAGRELKSVLVQPMAAPGIEMIVGITRDPAVGPVLLVGAGGVLTDLLNDVVVGVPPLSTDQIRALIMRLRCRDLLEGYRGSPAHDIEALIEVVGRVAEIALKAEGSLLELDLNPVIVGVEGLGCQIVDVVAVSE